MLFVYCWCSLLFVVFVVCWGLSLSVGVRWVVFWLVLVAIGCCGCHEIGLQFLIIVVSSRRCFFKKIGWVVCWMLWYGVVVGWCGVVVSCCCCVLLFTSLILLFVGC